MASRKDKKQNLAKERQGDKKGPIIDWYLLFMIYFHLKCEHIDA